MATVWWAVVVACMAAIRRVAGRVIAISRQAQLRAGALVAVALWDTSMRWPPQLLLSWEAQLV